MGKKKLTATPEEQSSPWAYDLLLCSISIWINLTRDCTVHKQTQNNFLTKLPAGVAKEMEGEEREDRGCPQFISPLPMLRFESLSSDSLVVSGMVNMK